jgi:BMFP domain-containing protein YqiC
MLRATMSKPTFLDELTDAVSRILPQAPGTALKENLRAALRAQLEKMDLVTREELDVQQAVLARTRAKLEALEQTVAELERQLKR